MLRIHQLGLSTQDREDLRPVPSKQERYSLYDCKVSIDSAMIWLKGSEWDTIVDGWRFPERGIDKRLDRLIRWINLTTDKATTPLKELKIQLAKLSCQSQFFVPFSGTTREEEEVLGPGSGIGLGAPAPNSGELVINQL
ncbi:hypothetical protein PGT21_027387 [Puccinia graminis f. sp. tritici]|uniref:Uncharacterized protein n=1 Tax=Puccinia graminis f. sp. tritici TaxID=56615 RepID=A0A5B0QPX2_PUCGR|nr:hypothetical protein PGT21_027387 [Puccinia graminis f. sp. tritici]